jgi:hypothetical protein
MYQFQWHEKHWIFLAVSVYEFLMIFRMYSTVIIFLSSIKRFVFVEGNRDALWEVDAEILRIIRRNFSPQRLCNNDMLRLSFHLRH